jgi:hypothetical protein
MNVRWFVPILTFASLQACAAVPLKPGADRVVVTRTPAPKDCEYVGNVVGSQGDALSGPLTSNRTLAEGALNDLKNRASDVGANYVVLETNQAGNTFSGGLGSGTGGFHGQQTDVTNVGTAYRCPSDEIGAN